MSTTLKAQAALQAIDEHPLPHRNKSTRVPKLSVSLYQHDIDRLDRIKDFMKSEGIRNLSDSEALRLACRRVEIDDSLVAVYRSMQSEDGRRRSS